MNEVTSVGHSTVLHYLSREMCKPHDSVVLSFVAVILHIFHFSTDADSFHMTHVVDSPTDVRVFIVMGKSYINDVTMCDDWYNTRAKHDHYSDVIMSVMTSQITSLTIVYLNVYWGSYQRKHQSSMVNSQHKGPATRKMFSFDDVIMIVCDPCA